MITQRQLTEITKKIVKDFQPERIILFGSYANGTPGENSDLDLLVIKDSELPRYKRSPKLYRLLRDYICSKDILVYTQQEIDDWKNVPQAFITTVMRQGKVLYENKTGIGAGLDKKSGK